MLLVTVGYNLPLRWATDLPLCWGWPLNGAAGGTQVGLLLGVGLSVFTAIDGLMLVFLFLPNPARRLCQWLIKMAVRIRPHWTRRDWGKGGGYLEEYRRGAELVQFPLC